MIPETETLSLESLNVTMTTPESQFGKSDPETPGSFTAPERRVF